MAEIPEELKVEVVTPFLKDRACKWWETVSPSLAEVEQITWQTFRSEFLKQYYAAEFHLQKLSEFESFKQTSDMTVTEYISRFNYLGTYVPTIMSDNTLNIHRFKKWLISRIQNVFRPTNFADLMGTTMNTEKDIKRCEEENKNKRPFIGQSAQGGPKFKSPNHSSSPSRGTFSNAGNEEGNWCTTFRQNHIEGCYRKTCACFKCVKVGHQIKDCPESKDKGTGPGKPNEKKPNTRVYAMTQEEADNPNDLVASTALLNKIHVYALFDCGAYALFENINQSTIQELQAEVETLTNQNALLEQHINQLQNDMVNMEDLMGELEEDQGGNPMEEEIDEAVGHGEVLDE
ncbi:uncharacterized protein [Primulina eburnea]|uniref:uncharacterized protein n=1 Tax=Primulina eburnea TaxID=1245227 RepID=UPI003C6CB2E2